jgi:RNA polymerase primary sigma factor
MHNATPAAASNTATSSTRARPRRSGLAPSTASLQLSPVIRAGLKKHAALSPAEEYDTAAAAWTAREEAWAIVLADPRASKAAGITDKNEADARTLAIADKDDVILRAAVDAMDKRQRSTRDARSCLARIDAAVGKLERHNIGLVLYVIRCKFMEFITGIIEVDDLLAWGMQGVRTAALRFDHRRGWKFSTFAVDWIRHAIGRGLGDFRHRVRIPIHLADSARKVGNAAQALIAGGLPVTDDALIEVADITPGTLRAVRAALAANTGPSMDTTIGRGGNDGGECAAFGSMLPDPDAMTEADYLDAEQMRDDLQWVRKAFDERLTPAEQFIIDCRFGLSRDADRADSRDDIGDVLGISRERVRQKENVALAKIRAEVCA